MTDNNNLLIFQYAMIGIQFLGTVLTLYLAHWYYKQKKS